MTKTSKSPQSSQYSKKRIKVAVMCISAVIIFYVGANFLKGINVFNEKAYYYCVMDDATGIQQSTPVMLSGYKVGMVDDVSLISSNPPKVCAKILLTEPIDIPTSSRFMIESKDLLGGHLLNLIMGNGTGKLQSGDTLLCSIKPGMLDGIDEIKGQISSVLTSIDTIGLSIKDVLHTNGGGKSLQATLQNIESTTENLNEILGNNKVKVGKLVTNLEKFSQTLESASPQLTSILENFDQISDTIAKADIAAIIQNANRTITELEAVVKKVNQGEGTVGELFNDDALATKLEQTINSVNDLVTDLKAHPKRYVHFSLFGKKDKDKNQKNK